MYFQIKVSKSGRFYNHGNGRVLGGGGLQQPIMLGLNFHVISIFCLHCTLHKIHMWNLFVYGKIFSSWKNQKQKKVLGEKKKKRKKNTQGRKKGYHSVKERKNSLICESNLYEQSFTLVSRFRAKKSLSNQSLPCVMLKTKFPFFMQVSALVKKLSSLMLH